MMERSKFNRLCIFYPWMAIPFLPFLSLLFISSPLRAQTLKGSGKMGQNTSCEMGVETFSTDCLQSDFDEVNLLLKIQFEFFETDLAKGQEDGAGIKKAYIGWAHFEVSPKDEKGALIFIPGAGEPFLKYSSLLLKYYKQGISIYTMDLRGQGLSSRLNKGTPAEGRLNVKNFLDEYVFDFQDFLTKISQRRRLMNYSRVPFHIIAHSAGGGIVGLYLLKQNLLKLKTPVMINGVILVSPMIGMRVNKYLYEGLNLTRKGNDFGVTQGMYSPTKTIDKDDNTSDEVRYLWYKNILTQSNLFVHGFTRDWASSIFRGSDQIKTLAKLTLDKSHLPRILILQAELESKVSNSDQDEFCESLGAVKCSIYRVKNSKHSILFEKDSIQSPVLNEITDFMRQTGGE